MVDQELLMTGSDQSRQTDVSVKYIIFILPKHMMATNRVTLAMCVGTGRGDVCVNGGWGSEKNTVYCM